MNEELINAIVSNDLATVTSLLDNIKDINYQSQTSQNYSFLHFAAQSQSGEITKLLLRKGADIELTDNYGNSPLWTAVFNYKTDGSVIQQLIKHGANPNHPNKNGKAPKDLAHTIANTDVQKYFAPL